MPVSEKKRASNAAWDKENMVRMSLALTKDEAVRMKAHIAETGEKANAFIRAAISEKLNRDGQKEGIQNASN